MKRFFAYCALLLCLVIYVVSSSDGLTRYLAQHRYYSNTLFASDKYRYGDMYGRTFLHDFKTVQANQPLNVKPEVYGLAGKKIVDVYSVHDSYLMRNDIQGSMDTMIQGLNKYRDIKWWKSLEGGKESSTFVDLDTSKENILLIEITERDLIRALVSPQIIYGRLKTKNSVTTTTKEEATWWYKPYALPNAALEDNLVFNMFDYHIFTPIRELKAFLNYKLFGRTTDDQVALSSRGDYLYWTHTVDENGSFYPVSDSAINHLVQSLNAIYAHYKDAGFDEVFFSAIPNPVVVLKTEPRPYNGLIPRIQNDTMLKMPVINAFEVLSNSKYTVFEKGESHWTRDGFQLWLNELNRTIALSSLKRHKA